MQQHGFDRLTRVRPRQVVQLVTRHHRDQHGVVVAKRDVLQEEMGRKLRYDREPDPRLGLRRHGLVSIGGEREDGRMRHLSGAGNCEAVQQSANGLVRTDEINEIHQTS
jgi:hypothetical protein